MTDHPLRDCLLKAEAIVAKGNAAVFQKFTCAKCGARQTIDVPNRFYTHATCDECGHVTDIQVSGCNYMLHLYSGTLMHGNAIVGNELLLVDCNQWMKDHPERKH